MWYSVIIPSRRYMDPQQNKCRSLFLIIVYNTCCHSICVAETPKVFNEFVNAALHISLQQDVQVSNSSVSIKNQTLFLTMNPRARGVKPNASLGASFLCNAPISGCSLATIILHFVEASIDSDLSWAQNKTAHASLLDSFFFCCVMS